MFRWFSIDNKDVDEIARLSETAWQTFESGFDTEVQGLFAEAHAASHALRLACEAQIALSKCE